MMQEYRPLRPLASVDEPGFPDLRAEISWLRETTVRLPVEMALLQGARNYYDFPVMARHLPRDLLIAVNKFLGWDTLGVQAVIFVAE